MANSTMKIELNGTLVTGLIDGVQNFTVTLRNQAEDGKLAKSFSSELTFYDDGYQILKTALIDDPFGFGKNVTIKIFDECCHEPVFEGLIKGDAIDWCEPKCYISANVIEDDEKINCIKSTLITDNWNGFEQRSFAPIRYCIEMRPDFFQYLLISLMALTNILFYSVILGIWAGLAFVFGIVYVICLVVDAIPGVDVNCNSPAVNPITQFNIITEFFKSWEALIVPCGRFHPSPYVRDYIKNACDKCGLQFQSSILNDTASPYYNAVLFAAQVSKGRAYDSTNFTLIQDNKPVETIETLMIQYLKPLFNAEFQIVNNVLVFERKDFFQTTTTWIDVEQLLNEGKVLNNEICFSWIDKERWSFGNFEYSRDAIDYIGNEAITRYNDIVEWNSPYNPTQSGSRDVTLLLSPARHRDDGIDRTVYDHFQTFAGGIVNFIYFGLFSDFDKTLLINQHTVSNYKLLIYDTNSGLDGLVKHDYSDAFCGGYPGPAPNERFNYPFWFAGGYQNNLYSLFHYIDDPRLPGTTQFNFNFDFEFDCDTYKNFDFGKTIRLIKNGQIVNGIIKEVQIDFSKRVIQVAGIV